RSNAIYFPIVSESTGDHGSGSVPSNVYSTGSVPSSFASSIYALIPSANQSSTSFASSEYISYESSAALLKPSVRKYLSVSTASFPTISLNVPEACLLDKSICTILLCAWIYPWVVYISFKDCAFIWGTPSSSVVTSTSSSTGISTVPSVVGIDL